MLKPLQVLEQVHRPEVPKNYQLAMAIPAGMELVDLEGLDLPELQSLHARIQETFMSTRKDLVDFPSITSPNYLDVKIRIATLMGEACELCERRCRANRNAGATGTCGVTKEARVSSSFLHYGEEEPLLPSGTIFFAGCNFKCVFCQNHDISTDPRNGVIMDPEGLGKIATSLARAGAKNINYVGGDPTPQIPTILASMPWQQVPVAQLWNSNFYNTSAAVDLLLDVMDIWLPDLKYGNDDCARQLSGVDSYMAVLTRNLVRVHDAMVVPGWASLIIRHLVLPGHVDCCSLPAMEWIAEGLPGALVNIMGQYRPEHLVLKHPDDYPDINRRPTSDEIRRVRDRATELGICWEPVS
jgi:putative pyruvate formate lyase activating enzyme